MNTAIILYALAGGVFTWSLTAIGGLCVIFVKKDSRAVLKFFLGFSAGVMLASSFWSLICPALTEAEKISLVPPSLTVCVGIISGTLFMYICDRIIRKCENSGIKSISGLSKLSPAARLMLLSITIHNIPEGLAVGIAFGACGDTSDKAELILAFTVALGIGIQNFPEGIAVALPLRKEGFSKKEAWFYAELSAVVEPLFAVIGALCVSGLRFILPLALSFAAGSMISVIVCEIIPECISNNEKEKYLSLFGVISGFCIMMLLDTI